jgi:hypothetical protein
VISQAPRFDSRRLRGAGLLVAISAVGIAACGGPGRSASAPCLKVPTTIPNDRLLTNNTKLRVPVGATVYVVLVQSEGYSGPGFPWQRPSSSDRAVLAPVRICRQTVTSTLPLSVSGFRAVNRGQATIAASLSAQWRSVTHKPQPAIDHVIVK